MAELKPSVNRPPTNQPVECSCPPGYMATTGIDPRTGCPPCIEPPTNEYGGSAGGGGKLGSGTGYGGGGPQKGSPWKMTPRSRTAAKNKQQETY